MQPFHSLTPLGQIRRLRRLAAQALAAYPLEVCRLRFLVTETNTMFRVDSASGQKFVLRIYSDEETTLVENQAEMFYLNAIRRDTDLEVVTPVARRDGAYITRTTVPGVPGVRRCALFHWVPGYPLEANLSPQKYARLGEMLAQLHRHAATLNPLPPDIRPKRWDKVFYYPDEPVVYHLPEYAHLFSPERIALIERVISPAGQLLADLYTDRDGMILIHGDLHFWNVHQYYGRLYLLDFEDIMLGYPAQDVAVTLSYGRERPDYSALRQAFIQGYASVRPWPSDERTEATLRAARTVMFINYAARILAEPEAYIAGRMARLGAYIDRFG